MRKKPGAGLRVVQVSDCHVSSDPDTDYRGVMAGSTLESLLPAILKFDPDLLLLTGDVSEDASPESYGRVSAMLSSIDVPVLALPGNHDNPRVMARCFPRGPWDGPLFYAHENWHFVLLDSTRPGEICGFLDGGHLEGLRQGLARSRAEHLLVALHHQPVEVGSPCFDRYPLQAPERLLEILEKEPRVRGIAWGHIHQHYSSEYHGIRMLGSPSSAANTRPGTERFTLDESGPACRWMVLGQDGVIQTGLLRV